MLIYECLEENKSTKSNALERKFDLGCYIKCSAGGNNKTLGQSAYLRPVLHSCLTKHLSTDVDLSLCLNSTEFHQRFFKLSITSEAKGFEFKYHNSHLQTAGLL